MSTLAAQPRASRKATRLWLTFALLCAAYAAAVMWLAWDHERVYLPGYKVYQAVGRLTGLSEEAVARQLNVTLAPPPPGWFIGLRPRKGRLLSFTDPASGAQIGLLFEDDHGLMGQSYVGLSTPWPYETLWDKKRMIEHLLLGALVWVAFICLAGSAIDRPLRPYWARGFLAAFLAFALVGVLRDCVGPEATGFAWTTLGWGAWPAVAAALAWLASRRHARLVESRREARCASCGYDLTANQSGICPECGTAIPAPTRSLISQHLARLVPDAVGDADPAQPPGDSVPDGAGRAASPS